MKHDDQVKISSLSIFELTNINFSIAIPSDMIGGPLEN